MRFYHTTTEEAAASILVDGFRDGVGAYLTTDLRQGVWLSNVPLGGNEEATGDTVLEVNLDVTEDDMAPYAWVQDESFGYREWLVPAELVNTRGRVRLVPESELFDEDDT
jgi:hypothetical protein